jgi:hypothetical protein
MIMSAYSALSTEKELMITESGEPARGEPAGGTSGADALG